MTIRKLGRLVASSSLCLVAMSLGWAPADGQAPERAAGWRSTTAQLRADRSPAAASPEPAAAQDRPLSGKEIPGGLPDQQGQRWREYDIRPYTDRVTDAERPEQAVLDWILRETGTEAWFTEPFGVLHVDRSYVRVYHTPETQRIVGELIDRFVHRDATSQTFAVRLVTVRSPSWRTRGLRVMRSVPTQTPGVEAWLLSREDSADLLGDLRKKVDFREHGSGEILIRNGQSHTVARLRPRSYQRSVQLNESAWPGYEVNVGTLEEGFDLQISPLLSADGRMADAVIRCSVNQIEKLMSTWIDVPTPVNARQRVQIETPQLASWQIHERFRWPADQVLLISRGMVATPDAHQPAIAGIPLRLGTGPPRADALLWVEARGKTVSPPSRPTNSEQIGGINNRGRY